MAFEEQFCYSTETMDTSCFQSVSEQSLTNNDGWDKINALIGTADAPEDWALEHNHYLYNTPKLQMTKAEIENRFRQKGPN